MFPSEYTCIIGEFNEVGNNTQKGENENRIVHGFSIEYPFIITPLGVDVNEYFYSFLNKRTPVLHRDVELFALL